MEYETKQETKYCEKKTPHFSIIPSHLCRLLLEGIQNTVDQLLLQLVVDVSCAQVAHDFFNGLHHHLPVLFCLVFQVINDT